MKKGTWSRQDQMKAAERGQGAEIGATHGENIGDKAGRDPNLPGSQPRDEAAFAGNKPRSQREKK